MSHERPKELWRVDHLRYQPGSETMPHRHQVHGEPRTSCHLDQVRQLPTVGEPRLIRQHVQASPGQVGNGLQLSVIAPRQHDEVAMPILNQALQELRAFMQRW